MLLILALILFFLSPFFGPFEPLLIINIPFVPFSLFRTIFELDEAQHLIFLFLLIDIAREPLPNLTEVFLEGICKLVKWRDFDQNAGNIEIKDADEHDSSVRSFEVAIQLQDLLPDFEHVEMLKVLLDLGQDVLVFETLEEVIVILCLRDVLRLEVRQSYNMMLLEECGEAHADCSDFGFLKFNLEHPFDEAIIVLGHMETGNGKLGDLARAENDAYQVDYEAEDDKVRQEVGSPAERAKD